MEQGKEYMRLMEQAPQIKASGLEGDYRSLAEFNHVVLAGHQTRFGLKFVTWKWVQNHTSLWQGHYYGNNYDAAKQDFAVRSNLVQEARPFSEAQLAEIYRSVQLTLETGSELTWEQEKTLQSISERMQNCEKKWKTCGINSADLTKGVLDID